MNNKVEYIGHYGSDRLIAQSGWTSTERELTNEKALRIPQFLEMLWMNGHETPFEKGIVHFLIDTEIASHIQLLKHRISSMNAECLSGESVITFVGSNNLKNGKKRTVKSLYELWNNGRKHQNIDKDKLYSRKRVQSLKIRVLDEKTKEFTYSHIKDIWFKGKQKVFKITLKNGDSLICTDNHAVYTNDGYKTLKNGLKIGSYVGCNGVKINVKERPWTFKEFFNEANSYTRKEFAEKNNLGYSLIKKWGLIFNVQFKVDTNKDFKKGNIPWNSGKAGEYKIDTSNRKHNPLKREESNFWKGGITSERGLIGQWVRSKTKEIQKKYLFICQECKKENKKLHIHHIIPVSVDISKAYDINNLIPVCKQCHENIHKSISSEMEFANKILNENFDPIKTEWGKNKKRIGEKLSIHYSNIVSIIFIGEEDTYDIEIEGNNNNFIANNIIVHNSARYKELKEDKFYLPEDWKGIIRQSTGLSWHETLKNHTDLSNSLYHESLKDIELVLGRKRAKESARFFKTYNSQIAGDVSFNLRSFANFLKLRDSEHAQKEIREIAHEMLNIVSDLGVFDITLSLFKKRLLEKGF